MTIRAMIVDDSAVMRRLLAMSLRPATDIEVVAMAANGVEALGMIDEVHPDLVTLDVEMPEMDGLETMQAIHQAHPDLAVIMCSGLTEQHAVTTINALRAGAVDHITKPVASSSDEALQTVHDQLVPKIRVLASRAQHRPRRAHGAPVVAAVSIEAPPAPLVELTAPRDDPAATTGGRGPGARVSSPVADRARRAPSSVAPDTTRSPGPPRGRGNAAAQTGRSTAVTKKGRGAAAAGGTPPGPTRPAPVDAPVGPPEVALRPWPATMPSVEVVAIGVSTGGPVVLERLLEALPEHFPVPIVIVQHMPAVFTKILAERLDSKSALRVREATGGELLGRGVWLAPGGLHLKVRRTSAGAVLMLDDGQPELSCKPAVDVLFRSVASVYGGHVLAAVLTGMGRDGTRGTEAVANAGGLVIAQDEATSTVWGMPGSVASVGLVNALVPLDDLALCIEQLVARQPWTPLVGSTA